MRDFQKCSLVGVMIFTLAIGFFFTTCNQDKADKNKRISMTPDITQRDPHGRYVDNGENYCGPCAAANGLIFLGYQGYDQLIPKGKNQQIRQYKLVTLLASQRYMQTAQRGQTGVTRLMEGIKFYVEDSGYELIKQESVNFKPHEIEVGSKPNVVETIKQALKPNSFGLIHIGWYYYDRDKDEYTRFSGHYVTVVGFGRDREGTPNDNIVIVHDPWNDIGDDYVELEKLKSGTLIIEKNEDKQAYDIKGAINLTGELCIYEKADKGLLDYIHIIELSPPLE